MVEYLYTTNALYCNNKWNARADIFKCHDCGSEFWNMPPVQKCLRKDVECICQRKKESKINKFINKFRGR